MRTTKSVTISLPPRQLQSAERLAKKQNRTMSELFREGLRRLEQEDRANVSTTMDLATAIRLIQQEAKRSGLNKMTSREIDAEIDAARRSARARRSSTR